MKLIFIYKIIAALFLVLCIGFLSSCKSKKKCPDFTQVDGRVKTDKNGLVKKKKVSVIRSTPNY